MNIAKFKKYLKIDKRLLSCLRITLYYQRVLSTRPRHLHFI